MLERYYDEYISSEAIGGDDGLILSKLIELCDDGTLKEEMFRLWK